MTKIVFLLLIGMGTVLAQDEPQTKLLWPNGAPGAQGAAEEDKPTLTVYQPNGKHTSATAVVVFPGGGYAHLAMNHEGRQIANWLNSYGIVAFVLKYRLGPRYHHPIELGDAQRAIRMVRAGAQQYGIDPAHIGVWGFSAGGHLASSVGTHFEPVNADSKDPIDSVSSRPDFLILSYPVISFTTPYTHKGSRQSLLGDQPDPQLAENLSNELRVTPQTPPTFLFHTTADATVPVENSILFYMALRKAGVPAEMHIFQNGPHGVGLGNTDPALAQWPLALANWLRVRGLLK
jgi:acetyl esterase/lipase